MTEYRFATPEEEADILDFINMVFSRAARPHDFEKLLPKVYAHPGFSAYHAIAAENGRIWGTVAMLPMEIHAAGCGNPLRGGYIGSVSVHPRARGEGHMRVLMDMQLQEARRRGYDFLALGGQRQRYGYWGFEKCGIGAAFHLNRANIRHTPQAQGPDFSFQRLEESNAEGLDYIARLHASQPLFCVRPRELLLDILRTYGASPYLIVEQATGKLWGYLIASGNSISELVLEDGANSLGSILRCWMADEKECAVYIPGFQPDLLRVLAAFSENYTVSDSQMLRVLRWDRVLEAGLRLAVQTGKPLPEGEITVEIETAGRFTLTHHDHQVSAFADSQGQPACRMTEKQATACFFSSLSALYPPEAALQGWLPLPLDIPVADQF